MTESSPFDRLPDDLKLYSRILKDPILQEVYTMRLQIRRRLHRRRVVLAGTLLISMVGAGAFGYLATTPKAGAARGGATAGGPLDLPTTSGDVPHPVAARNPGAKGGGRVVPVAPASETMRLSDGRDIPLFAADEAEANQGRRHYLYPAPIAVTSEPRYDPKARQITVVCDMTAPIAARDRAAKDLAESLTIAGASRPRVLVQPLTPRSYTVELIADEMEGPFRIGSAGDGIDAMASVPGPITYSAVIPEAMSILGEKLHSAPREVRVRLRAVYDFERVVAGSISVARVGDAIHRVLEEVRSQLPEAKNAELYVNRQACERLLARIGESIELEERNSGLSDEAFAAFVNEARQSLKEQLDALPRRDVYTLLTRDANEVAFVYTAPDGKVEARPITSHEKTTMKERSEQYSQQASEALKIVQDFYSKGEFDQKAHEELRKKFAADGKLGGAIKLFKLSAKLKLDKSAEQITDGEIRAMKEDRAYWLNDAQLSEESTAAIRDKFLGDIVIDKTLAKPLDLCRLDERELTANVKARARRVLSVGFEGLGLLTEANLVAIPAAKLGPVAQASVVPIGGTLDYFGRAETVPTDFLIADGRAVSRDEFRELFDVIGTMYGRGDGSTTFNLPDLRGEFTRGADDMGTARGARGVDSGRVVGMTQSDGLAQHRHLQSLTVNTVHRHRVLGLYEIFGNARNLVNDLATNQPCSDNKLIAAYPYGNKWQKLPDGVSHTGANAGPAQPGPFEGEHDLKSTDSYGYKLDNRMPVTAAVGDRNQPIEGSVGEATGDKVAAETRPRNTAAIIVIRGR